MTSGCEIAGSRQAACVIQLIVMYTTYAWRQNTHLSDRFQNAGVIRQKQSTQKPLQRNIMQGVVLYSILITLRSFLIIDAVNRQIRVVTEFHRYD